MLIKILTSVSGTEYSFAQNQTADVEPDTAKDLIDAGYAVELKTPVPKKGGSDAEPK